MQSLSQSEENYLKAIFKLSYHGSEAASTNAIASEMSTSAASVSDMLKRLSGKGLIKYEKHRGATLSAKGLPYALQLVRKHRLWEVFLVKTLGFKWDEVHDIAEQLEHIKSPELVSRLDNFLGHPRFDPHGDPIPDAAGKIVEREEFPLHELAVGSKGIIVAVANHTSSFLQYLDQHELLVGTAIEVLERFEFDNSVRIKTDHRPSVVLSEKVAVNLLIQPTSKNRN
ncbi:MAG: metal-dependent transcriptional regulator [Saprospiraceae bacterium]